MIVKLQTAWTARLKLRAEAAKVWAEAAKVWAEGDKLRAEGAKLWAEGDKLRAEGDRLWAEMIIAVHGNITLKWTWRGDVEVCTLGTGETFRGDQPIEGE
jgi:hypothetical protein